MVSQAASSSASPATRRRESVLVVEDEETSRKAMCRLLANYGFRPEAFPSAEQALQFLDSVEQQPGIALVDLDLPGISGLDLIERLGTINPSVYPVLITGTDHDTLMSRLVDRPVHYFRKPLNFDALLTLLSEKIARG